MTNKSRKQQLEEMLEAMPNDAELRYMVAMEYAGDENDEEALRQFEETIRQSPNYAPAYHQAGRTLVRLGRIDKAKIMLERGIPIAQHQENHHAAGEMMELLESL